MSIYLCYRCGIRVRVDPTRKSGSLWKHEIGETDHKAVPILQENHV